MKDLSEDLARRKAEQLYRRRRIVDGPQSVELQLEGKPVLSFCSNDYLGLASDPRVVAALIEGAKRFGAGSGAAHLISGHSRAHHALEEALAAFVQRPRALLFSTGYMANLGVFSALLGRHDHAFEDRWNHASLLDAARLSGAKLQRYAHGNSADLEAKMQAAAPKSTDQSLIATDGVFSMDGDIAPLHQLAAVARRQSSWLLVDDAHGLGVMGEAGCGSVLAAGLNAQDVPIYMGTLGKALGTAGAFVAGSEALIETLIQQSRPYMYTTATPPAVAWATLTALQLVQQDSWRRERLRDLVEYFRQGAAQLNIPLMASDSPIQPVMIGAAAQALAISEALLQQGIWVSAIRPPTVPAGTSRLRVTLSAQHSRAQVDRLLAGLHACLNHGTAGRNAKSDPEQNAENDPAF